MYIRIGHVTLEDVTGIDILMPQLILSQVTGTYFKIWHPYILSSNEFQGLDYMTGCIDNSPSNGCLVAYPIEKLTLTSLTGSSGACVSLFVLGGFFYSGHQQHSKEHMVRSEWNNMFRHSSNTGLSKSYLRVSAILSDLRCFGQ